MKQEPRDQRSDVTVIACKREESYATSNRFIFTKRSNIRTKAACVKLMQDKI